jgi:putative tricarboxylic transport membrane protein
MENSFHQSMLIGNHSFAVFLDSPIAIVLLCIATLSVFQATPLFGRIKTLWRQRRAKN